MFQGDHHAADGESEISTLLRAPVATRFAPGDEPALQSVFQDRAARQDERKGRDNRKVLFVVSRFPPVASVGAIRVRKFAKYLPRNGWTPVVITGAAREARSNFQDARRATDYASLSEIPADVPVHRLSAALDHWPTYVMRGLSSRLGGLTKRWGGDAEWWKGLLGWRMLAIHDRLAFPDRGIWRLPAAVKLALSLHRRHNFDAIFTSGMPFSDHLIGLVLHETIRRPWLADFRDPWVEYIHWQQWASPIGRSMTQWCEAAVVSRASRVISVNDQMTERFSDRYGSRSKFVTIENGFDADDFPLRGGASPSSEFRLLYAGSLYKTRSPLKLLEGFRQFVEQTPGAAQRCRMEFAGRPGPFTAAMEAPGVRHVGMLSHGETVRRMADADVNVILLPNLPGGLGDSTAKVYECLGSGRAILAIIPPGGAAARTLAGFDGVWLCDPDDAQQIARVLGDLYRKWLSGDLQPERPAVALSRMTRGVQAEALADCLDAVSAVKES